MYYSKIEKYSFSSPSEYKAYLDFKHKLDDVGVAYKETHDLTKIEIEIVEKGRFDVSDDIWQLRK